MLSKRFIVRVLIPLALLLIGAVIFQINQLDALLVSPLPAPEDLMSAATLADYSLSFFDVCGHSISEQRGQLKLVMDPYTIYANYPNQSSASFTIDSHGFRGGCATTRGPQAIVIGGSATFGFGLSSDKQTLSCSLSRKNSKYDFVNAGVVGFLSGQELAQMVHYLDDFHPALYIVLDGLNDVGEPWKFVLVKKFRPVCLGFNSAFLLIGSRLAQFADYRQHLWNIKAKALSLPMIQEPISDKEWLEKVTQTYTSNIIKMNSFAHSRNAKFLLVFQPELGSKRRTATEEKLWKDSRPMFGGDRWHRHLSVIYRKFVQDARRILEARGVRCIDMNDRAEISDSLETLYVDGLHPNARGNEVMAKVIDEELTRLRL